MNDFIDLDKASKRLSKLQNVRIIYLPPMTVATYTYMERKDPHDKTKEVIMKFVKDSGLLNLKPDARHFALDYPMFNFDPPLGHERWVTIPDDMEVAPPLVKKKFLGGMYVSCLQGEHDTALGLQDWINESEEYQCEATANRVEPHTPGLSWVLEEELNFFHNTQNLDSPASNHIPLQIDYLFSIKPIVHVEEVVTEIADSVEKCGFKAQLITKNKIKIYGFSQFCSGRRQDIWQDLKTDGQLDIIQKYRKPGASIVSLSSMDCGCHGQDGSRTTIGLFEPDITDIEAFEAHVNHIHQLDASLWLRFEKTEGIDYNWIEVLPKMGYKWNALISGNFEEYLDGVVPLTDERDKSNSKRIYYGWHSVLPQ